MLEVEVEVYLAMNESLLASLHRVDDSSLLLERMSLKVHLGFLLTDQVSHILHIILCTHHTQSRQLYPTRFPTLLSSIPEEFLGELLQGTH